MRKTVRKNLIITDNSGHSEMIISLTYHITIYMMITVDKKGALELLPLLGMAFKRSGVQFPLAPDKTKGIEP